MSDFLEIVGGLALVLFAGAVLRSIVDYVLWRIQQRPRPARRFR